MHRKLVRVAIASGLTAILVAATLLGVALRSPRAASAQVHAAATDLGSLDGVGSGANSINKAGQVVGRSGTSDGNSRPFIWQNGTMTALATSSGEPYGGAISVNNFGVIVGTISGPFGNPSDPVVWASATSSPSILPTVPGSVSTGPAAINDQGQIIGGEQLSSGDSRGVLWQNASATPVELSSLPSYPECSASAINDSGQIVGTCSASAGGSPFRPVMWQSTSAVPVDLGTLGGTNGTANGINSKGQVVGWTDLAGDLLAHATLWDHGAIVDLGTLGGPFSIATAINSKGQITGWSTSPSGALIFLWKNGTMTDISAGTQGNAFGINDKGQVVGIGSSGGGGPSDATLWSTTGK